jgi:hypothetical protein
MPLQLLYTIRSERLLMEQLEYNLPFRWFVGPSANEQVWHHTVFSKNRNRLLDGAVAEEFFSLIVQQARAKRLLSDEHFTVDAALIEAWAGHKSFQPKQGSDDILKPPPPKDHSNNPTLNWRKEKRSNQRHTSRWQARGGSVRLDENHSTAAENALPRTGENGLDVHLGGPQRTTS